MTLAPPRPEPALGELAFSLLQSVVAVDSQSDEASTTIPTTEGQRRLADQLASFYAGLGATIERDENANVLAWFPGTRPGAAPVAFMVHVDTARGTQAVPALNILRAWDGTRVPYPRNPTIQVDLATYPAAASFAGHDLVYGNGDFPFGLDDKLGLSYCMALATLLAESTIDRPPIVFIGRPDEEVGRDAAVVGLAALLQERGVRCGYTVDGILPFEVNVENFNAAVAHVVFPKGPARRLEGSLWVAHIGGVNTHGATAQAEGHRAAPRLVAEWRAALSDEDVVFGRFESDALRDCDAVVHLLIAPGAEDRVRAALDHVMGPHLRRGASATLAPASGMVDGDGGAEAMLAWLTRFYASNPGFTLPAEDSGGRDGYSHPYRARPTSDGLKLDVRIRDFTPEGREARIEHVRGLAEGLSFAAEHQYENMGPRMAAHPELVEWAKAAAADIGLPISVTPIRGGTGVDPFLDRGIPVANLGTGYFAPESEKELTSLQVMARHVAWLYALVQRV